MQTINPNMILLAREARGLTQTCLAQKLNTYKSNISRLEHGDAGASENTLLALAAATGFPPQFFVQTGDKLPPNLSYRMRKHVPAKLITPIEAQINIIHRQLQLVTGSLQQLALRSIPKLPGYQVDEQQNRSPQKIATLLRRKWNIAPGPLHNMAGLLDQQGIIISSFDFGTPRVDSRCMLTNDDQPIIFLNSSLLGDRQRFSLAFELGHLIMHTFCTVPHTRDINHEANLFAAEFLAPAKDIAADFKDGITLPLLGELKRKWKISMIALLYRAHDLALLTPNQKRYLVQQFNRQKIRRREPPQLDVPIEKPALINELLRQFKKAHRLTSHQLAALLAIEMHDFKKYYPG